MWARAVKQLVAIVAVVGGLIFIGAAVWLASPTSRRDKAQYKLIVAIEQDDVPRALMALREGANLNARGYTDDTPTNASEISREFSREYYYIDPISPLYLRFFFETDRGTPMRTPHYRELMLKVLLDHGADMRAHDEMGHTALILAARNGCSDWIPALVAHKARVDARDFEGGTALHSAAGAGNSSAILALIGLGADVNATDKNGATPCIWAVRAGSALCVQALLAEHAAVNYVDSNRKTALDYANDRENAAITAALRCAGAKMAKELYASH
jgi:hypothetical protein